MLPNVYLYTETLVERVDTADRASSVKDLMVKMTNSKIVRRAWVKTGVSVQVLQSKRTKHYSKSKSVLRSKT